jgi:hypothetical protein
MYVEYVHLGAADSPLLRFYNFTRPELADLVATFDTLAGSASRLSLRVAPGKIVTAVNFKSLNVGNADRDFGVIPRENDTFDWLLTGSTWQDVADRARQLAPSLSTFQWLDESSSISVLLSQSGQW